MMKNLTTLLFLFISLNAVSQVTYVPDDNFEQALIDLGYDTGVLDDYVPTANISTVSNLSVWNKNIANLAGIEDFMALEVLDCSLNQLTNLDISQNMALSSLNCSRNQLITLDVTQNANLGSLVCHNNQLSSLNLTQNTALVSLICLGNQLINLDLSQNIVLAFLDCSDNQLTSLNVRNGNNSNFPPSIIPFSTFNTVNNPDLNCIEVDDAAWSTVNWMSIDTTSSFSENCSSGISLTYVPDDIFEQRLIDLGYDTGTLDDYVPTANIDTITTLVIPNTGSIGSPPGISDLTGIEDFTALEVFNCSANVLSSLDLSQNVNLTALFCTSNSLTDLNITQNVNLLTLRCSNNSLTSLDLTQNTALEVLNCEDNLLTSLDVTQNPNLKELNCARNQLTNLLTQNENLERLDCNNNQLSSLCITGNTALEVLNCRNNLLTSLDVTQNTALTFLFCQTNQLSNLDVSQNTALTSLGCAINQLTSLDVTQNTALFNLGCAINQLETIDLTQNTVLNTLNCQDNQLTNLDVSQNVALRVLSCEKNLLTDLDVKNGNNINFLYFNAVDNPNLSCIKVDDASWSEVNWTNIDATAGFDEKCMETAPDDNFVLALRNFSTTIMESNLSTTNKMSNSMWNDNAILELSLFPNPTSTTFNIKGIQEISKIEVYSLNGSLLLKQTNYTDESINVSNLAAAVYLVKVFNHNGSVVLRLIKE